MRRAPRSRCYVCGAVSRLLALTLFLCAAGASAQADLPDAGLPDAAVGGTGAERSSEEEDQSLSTPCLSDRDCDRGFQCINSTCRWQRYRDATFEGCSTTGSGWLLGAAVLLASRRHFLSKRTK